MASEGGLRYTTGAEVLCRTSKNGWTKGTIVNLNYREPDWPKEQIVPYLVELSDGELIAVPADSPCLCMKHSPPSWEKAVTDQDMADLTAAVTLKGCEETDHIGRTALLSCIQVGWQEGALFLISQRANPCVQAGPEKCTPLHLAVLPLARVTFEDMDMDRATFSRKEGEIFAKLDSKGEPSDEDDWGESITDVDYDETEGRLTWTDVPHPTEDDLSWSDLPPPLRAWVPERLAALLEGTAVRGKGLPRAGSRMPLINALLERRADVNAQNQDPENDVDSKISKTFKGLVQDKHRTVLHYAAEAGDSDLCETLITARAIVDIEDSRKMTPLDVALEEGSHLLAAVLLRKAADPNRGNMQRGLHQTALHQMSDLGDSTAVELLLKHRGQVNAVGKQGMTPLHFAARRTHVDVVKMLVASAADIGLLDNSGRTPSQYALLNKSSDLAKALSIDDSLQLSDRIALLDTARPKAKRQCTDQKEYQALLESLYAT